VIPAGWRGEGERARPAERQYLSLAQPPRHIAQIWEIGALRCDAGEPIQSRSDSAIRRGAQHQRAVTAEQNRDIAIGPRGRDDWGAGTADGSPVLRGGEFAKAGVRLTSGRAAAGPGPPRGNP